VNRGNYVTLGQDQDSTDSSLSAPPAVLMPGNIAVDPIFLFVGLGLLALGTFFLGGRVEPQRHIRERRRSYHQRKLRELAEE